MRISDWSSDVCSSDLLGAQRGQRLDQHGGLDRHVQRADDACALQRLRRAEFLAQGHQAGHFGFGDVDLAAAVIGQRDVADHIVFRSEEHTSELQSLMRNSYAVFCLKKKKEHTNINTLRNNATMN